MIVPLVAAVAILAAACGGSASAEPGDGGASSLPPADTCLAGTPDCQDNPAAGDDGPPLLYGDEPGGGVVGGGSTPLVVNGGLSVSEALSTNAAGVIAVGAFYFSNGTDTWLCDSLAESYPPQCAGDRVPFEGDAAIDPEDLDEAQGITWSAQPVTVLGSIADGVFVATLLSQ
jgi:hypothetical protein